MGRDQSGKDDHRSADQQKADADNHSNQMNPNNDAYWDSRGSDRDDDDKQGQGRR